MKVIRQDVIDRLISLKDDGGYSLRAFAKKCDVDSSAMKRKLAGNETITVGNILKFSRALGVNRKWLDTGEGDKYPTYNNVGNINNMGAHIENSPQVAMGASIDGVARNNFTNVTDNVSKDMLIEVLQQQVADLRQQLSEQQQQNKMLMQMLNDKNTHE